MAYKTSLIVRFGDTDRAGIVYQPVILHYFHIAMEDFFGEFVGIPYNHVLETDRVGFPAVSDASRYLRPIKFGDVLEIKLYVSRIGTSSMTFEFEAYRKQTGELLARSTQTRVTVSTETWESIPIPRKYREKLAACGPE